MLEKIDLYFGTQEQILYKKEQEIRKKIRIGKHLDETLQDKKQRKEKVILYKKETGIRKE